MKKAIITGITGQDGAYLAKNLLSRGYKVIGARRRNTGQQNWRLKYLGIEDEIEMVDFDLTEPYSAENIISKYQPDEFYNLGAQSFVALSFTQPHVTTQTNANGVLHILEAIRQRSPHTKFYQASTSEMFGRVRETPQNELTPFHPRSPYGVAKAYAHYMTINYRESYDMFACCGILFNHESPLRGSEFVTQKIVKGLVEWVHTKQPVYLGNLDAKRDWGHAEDYVEAMRLILQQDKPEDFVISTGVTHTIRDFIEKCLKYLNIDFLQKEHEFFTPDGTPIIKTAPEFFRPAEVDVLLGDCSKAKKILQWKPKYNLDTLIGDMIKSEEKVYEK
jgi:GDPmannose 4,6-dehydratase